MRVLGLGSGTFRALHRPEALCFRAFWCLGRAGAKWEGGREGADRGSLKEVLALTGALGKPGTRTLPAWRPENGMILARSLALGASKLLLIRREDACRLSELAPDPSITLLNGPERGFAAEEVSAAERAGFAVVQSVRPAGPAPRRPRNGQW
jgi:hypothetical protein